MWGEMSGQLMSAANLCREAVPTAYRRITVLTTVKTEDSAQTTALAVNLFIKIDELIHSIISKAWFTASKLILTE